MAFYQLKLEEALSKEKLKIHALNSDVYLPIKKIASKLSKFFKDQQGFYPRPKIKPKRAKKKPQSKTKGKKGKKKKKNEKSASKKKSKPTRDTN